MRLSRHLCILLLSTVIPQLALAISGGKPDQYSRKEAESAPSVKQTISDSGALLVLPNNSPTSEADSLLCILGCPRLVSEWKTCEAREAMCRPNKQRSLSHHQLSSDVDMLMCRLEAVVVAATRQRSKSNLCYRGAKFSVGRPTRNHAFIIWGANDPVRLARGQLLGISIPRRLHDQRMTSIVVGQGRHSYYCVKTD